MLARILHDVAQALDAVALHEPHGSGIEEGPDRLAAVLGGNILEAPCHLIERLVPAHRLEGLDADALLADPSQRRFQAARMMDALGIARDLGADHTAGVGVLLGAPDPADGMRVDPFDFERAAAWAVMGTGGMDDIEGHGAWHSRCLPANYEPPAPKSTEPATDNAAGPF